MIKIVFPEYRFALSTKRAVIYHVEEDDILLRVTKTHSHTEKRLWQKGGIPATDYLLNRNAGLPQTEGDIFPSNWFTGCAAMLVTG